LNDPTEEEESFASSKVTIVLVPSPDQKSFELCHILKHGGKPIGASTLQKCITTAKQQAKAIKKLTEKYTE
jgi:exosome complex RNA-binding protein Rrp42 (RNase PH superfamily)